MRGLMGGFYRISEWIMRFSVINLLWLVFSLPFVILAYNAIWMSIEVSRPAQLMLLFMPAVVVCPFTLFPASAAMFAVARKWVMGEEETPLWRTFWKGYRENYRQSMLGGLFFAAVGAILAVNFYFYSGMSFMAQALSYLFIVLFVVLIISSFYYFSLMVHMHMTFRQLLKNSLLLTGGRLMTSVVLLAFNVGIVYFSFVYFTFMIVFFMGSVMAVATFWQFYRVFNRIRQLQEERQPEDLSRLGLDDGSAERSGN